MKTTTTLFTGLIACSLAFAPRTNAQNCNAGFIFSVVDTAPFIVQFYDSSWYPDNSNINIWFFGDGTSDTNNLNPLHTFPQFGNYTVCLFIYDSNWVFCDTLCMQVPYNPPPACQVYFGYSQSTFNFSFSGYSQNAATWSWDFGDGNSANIQSPSHTYAQEGYYYVCLTIADTGTCTDTYCEYVWAGCYIDSGFYYSTNGTTVQFNYWGWSQDSATTVVLWDFGDGNTSALKNPVHVYATWGNYNVCLYIQDTAGICADTLCQTVPVSCINASFGYNYDYQEKYTISFTDYSGGNIVSWLWDFGDGATDTVADPVHSYITYGYYSVCLTVVTADSCTDQYCSYVYLDCCELDFEYTFSGAAVSFGNYNDSLACAWFYSYHWDFGDGVTATQVYYDPDMQHVYLTPGIYTVCLAAGQDTSYYQWGCHDSICKNIIVELGDTCAGLQVDIGGWGVRPQIQTNFVIHYCNYGNTQSTNTSLSINLNSLINPDYSVPAWSTQTGNTVTWNLGSLAAGDCGDIYLYVTGDASAQTGSVLCSDAIISSSTDECDTTDNTVEACFNVVNSFDPNDKRLEAKNFAQRGYVENDTIFPSDKDLSYMIRFQNTGTAPAINIFIYDTLDAYLDPATVIAGASSHPHDYFEITGNVVKWTFLNINLADSTNNEPASHGFVKFSVSQKPGNQLGTLIPNHSGIVFDFNVPVITNNAIVLIDSFTTVMELDETEMLTLFPNPVKEKLVVALPENFHALQCQIRDITGKAVYHIQSINLSGGNKSISLQTADLPAGVYYIAVTGAGGARAGAVFMKE